MSYADLGKLGLLGTNPAIGFSTVATGQHAEKNPKSLGYMRRLVSVAKKYWLLGMGAEAKVIR